MADETPAHSLGVAITNTGNEGTIVLEKPRPIDRYL